MKGKLIILVILNIWFAILIAQDIKFDKLIVNDLPYSGSVLSVLQDSKGYIWLATINGLGLYDSKKLTYFYHKHSDTSSISDNFIISINEDIHGNIWIGTINSLNKYLPVTKTFKRYNLNLKESTGFTGNNVIALNADSKGRMWIIVQGETIIYDPFTDIFFHKKIPSPDGNSYVTNIQCIYEDREGVYWVGTSNGLYIYNPNNEKILKRNFNSAPSALPGKNFINIIRGGVNGNVWIGTFGGLYIFDRAKQEFLHFTHNPGLPNTLTNDQVTGMVTEGNSSAWICTSHGLNYCYYDTIKEKYSFRTYESVAGDNSSLSSNSLTSIIRDKEDRYWISSLNGGVDIYDHKQKKFRHFAHNPLNINSLSHNNVTCFTEDRYGNIWIATDGGGLNRISPETQRIDRYQYSKPGTLQPRSNKTLSVLADSYNKLWIGYWESGLDCYDLNTKKMERFNHNSDNPASLASNYVFKIIEDSRKNIWICHWGGGLTCFDRKSNTFSRFPKKQHGFSELSTATVINAFEDRQGVIWFGTEHNGLYSYNLHTDAFRHYTPDGNSGESINHLTVLCIFEDSRGRLWVGTRGNGINMRLHENDIFRYYTTNEGLPDNIVYGFVESADGTIWISTHKGIARLFVDESDILHCKVYDRHDGLQGDIFNQWASFKSRSGHIFFGGLHGMVSFLPEEILDNASIPEVRVTGIYIFDEPLSAAPYGLKIRQPVDEITELALSYRHSKITFEFTAQNYTQPSKNHFAYFLEGFDKEWHYSGNYNRAIYTNLNPGKYVFRVIASNNDGVWNESGTSIKITVSPPFWQTVWFISLAGLCFILAILWLFRLRLKKYRQEIIKQRETETILRKAKQKSEESDMLKSTILANISHEIRTPINGIVGFTDLLARPNLDEKKKEKYIKIIKSRYNDLIKTMDTILDISTLVSGGIKLFKTKFPLKVLIKEVLQITMITIEESSKEINCRVEYHDGTDNLKLVEDYSKIRSILVHLTDNAVKFSEKGTVQMVCSYHSGKLIIAVQDNGIGIPDEDKDLIFEQFRQADLGINRKYGGMGLGLSLCKGYIEHMEGQIWFESKIGEGSVFYISLPCNIAEDK